MGPGEPLRRAGTRGFFDRRGRRGRPARDRPRARDSDRRHAGVA